MLSRLALRLAVGHLLLLGVLLAVLGGTGAFDRATLLVAAAATGAALATSVSLAAAALGPLAHLTQAARGIARGDLGQRVRAGGDLREQAEAFNEMAQSVEGLVAAASQEQNRLVAVLNSVIDAVVAIDPEGRVTFANAEAERLFGRTHDELVGNPLGWAMPDDEVLEAARASREEGSRETRLIERPQRRYLQVVTTPIVGGGDWSALVLCHDLTDAKRLEQVRRDFVANVSHELRTPLASMKSVIETLRGGAVHNEKAAREFLALADGEVDRLVQMVEELLELSRIESGDVPLTRRPVDLAAALARAVERLRVRAERQGLRLTLQVAPGLPPITGDAERLERVAVNLIQNALNFTPAGGSINVSACREDGAVTVRVRDTGVGIAPEDLPRIFERFYKADRVRGPKDAGLAGGGTGLGLAIVKHTVEAHGGRVSVESRMGEGATFTVTVPLSMPSKAD